MSDTPNPGSDAAIEAGCTCPVLDNHHGKGFLWDGAPVFSIDEGCPLHGKRNKQRTPMTPTKRQREVLAAIEQLTKREGYPPTIREVANRLNTLPSNIHQILARLRNVDLVAWDKGRLRTLRVVQ